MAKERNSVGHVRETNADSDAYFYFLRPNTIPTKDFRAAKRSWKVFNTNPICYDHCQIFKGSDFAISALQDSSLIAHTIMNRGRCMLIFKVKLMCYSLKWPSMCACQWRQLAQHSHQDRLRHEHMSRPLVPTNLKLVPLGRN